MQKDDVIYKQDAIEIVDFECGEWRGLAKTIVDRLSDLPSVQPESYKVKLKEIADALSEKFAYMNTCLNERDIILGYLGVKRRYKTHCNTDCTNTKCESHPLSSAQPEQRWVPVTERLPKEDHWLGGSGRQFSDEVLVSVANYDDEDIWTYISQTIDGEWALELPNHCKIIAWMPLPAPYREGDTE